MDILDVQLHFSGMSIEELLAGMDAIGVRAALIDEFDDNSYNGDFQNTSRFAPYVMVGDVPRPVGPNAEAAARKYPDRLSYLLRILFDDPDLEALVRLERQAGLKALRAKALSPHEVEGFRNGEYRRMFATAADNNLPLFISGIIEIENLPQYLEAFPQVPVTLDACGGPTSSERYEYILGLARYPNLHMKWGHMQRFFNCTKTPYPELIAPLRAYVDAYGADRMLWYSDITHTNHALPEGLEPHTWAEDLYFIKASPVLSEEEKVWMLGKTARKLLNWPA